MDRRRSLMGVSESGEDNIIVISPSLNYEEILSLVDYFHNKYGTNYGSKRSPGPIDENVVIENFLYTNGPCIGIKTGPYSVLFYGNQSLETDYGIIANVYGTLGDYFYD